MDFLPPNSPAKRECRVCFPCTSTPHLSKIRIHSTNAHVHCVRSSATDRSRPTANAYTTDGHMDAWAYRCVVQRPTSSNASLACCVYLSAANIDINNSSTMVRQPSDGTTLVACTCRIGSSFESRYCKSGILFRPHPCVSLISTYINLTRKRSCNGNTYSAQTEASSIPIDRQTLRKTGMHGDVAPRTLNLEHEQMPSSYFYLRNTADLVHSSTSLTGHAKKLPSLSFDAAHSSLPPSAHSPSSHGCASFFVLRLATRILESFQSTGSDGRQGIPSQSW